MCEVVNVRAHTGHTAAIFHYPLLLYPVMDLEIQVSILLSKKQASEQRPRMTVTTRHPQSAEMEMKLTHHPRKEKCMLWKGKTKMKKD